MKILILGGGGVIGSGIYKILSKKYNVYILNSKIYDRKNNHYFLDKKIKFDVFIHAGGVTDEEIKYYGKESSIKRSSIALTKLINHLKINKCKKFVYISSQRVYLNFYRPDKAIFNETRSKTKPTTIYEKCHLLSENILKKISKKKNCKSLIIRPGVVFGIPSQNKKISRPNLIQHAFLNSLINNDYIEIKSSGEQFRNFSINEDIGKIILNWINKKKNKEFVISNAKGRIITVNDFAQMCCREYEKITSRKTKIIILGKKKSKFKPFKINQQIKFKSNVNLNLKKFIQSYLKIGLKKN
jgi:nucleoside-diphosphate-sugar epimerase